MRCNQSIVGTLGDKKIIAYNVKFENGFEVEVLNLGGVITKIITPDKDNNFENLGSLNACIDRFMKEVNVDD